jgi:hypothetical protein
MKWLIHDKCKPGHAPAALGKSAALLGGLVLALTLPGTCLMAQVLGITNAVLLSWPEPTQEQIVVGADSLASNAVWTPWPEPIFKRHGELCMAVPTTASQQFFKAVLGRQFVDDFSDCWGPFTNRNSYMDWFKEDGEQWFVTNGVLKFTGISVQYPGFLVLPVGTNAAAKHEDFYTSVEILDWVTSTNNWDFLSLFGRGIIYSPTYVNGYIGGLALNFSGIPGQVRLSIWDGYVEVFGPSFDMGTNPLPYRLEFSGVGNPICQLRLRVLSLPTMQLIREQTLVATRYAEGFPGFWINSRNQAGDTYRITTDNFFLSGTKP